MYILSRTWACTFYLEHGLDLYLAKAVVGWPNGRISTPSTDKMIHIICGEKKISTRIRPFLRTTDWFCSITETCREIEVTAMSNISIEQSRILLSFALRQWLNSVQGPQLPAYELALMCLL